MRTKRIKINKPTSIKKRILKITLASSLVPLCITLIVGIISIRNYIITTEIESQQEYARIITYNLNSKIQSYNESLSYLVHNDILLDVISEDQTTNFDMYDAYRNYINPIFNTVLDQHSDIESITLYTNKPLYDHGQYIKHLSEEEIHSKFDLNRYSINKFKFNKENNKIEVYNQIVRNDIDTLNVISISINLNAFYEPIFPIRAGTENIIIQNANTKDRVFEFSNQNEPDSFIQSSILSRLLFIPEFTYQSFDLNNNWSGTIKSNISSLYEITNLIIIIGLISIIFIFLLTFYLLRYLTNTIANPISNLVYEMSQINETNFEIQKKYYSQDEIGSLYQSFSDMLKRINSLINDVYNAEVLKQKSELKSLQSQINPHFFYNSLSLINNKAILSENEDISEMAQLLSKYFRLSLNQGNETIPVKNEMELTISYAKIQQKMQNNAFKIDIDIDESIYQFEMINLIIQPFVENAIIHGLSSIEDDRIPVLNITARNIDDTLQFIIKDNGIGMEQTLVDSLLSYKSQHYGIKNVEQRLNLYYGTRATIQISSEKDIGTIVILNISSALKIS
ncbi:sensor histidine kinase [Fundicoccus culcitae]|uniref:Histidine kinase n=1 Tax=Fundicoccus culcitae TaxID=2969821 RepID=A0ABY5P8Q0_9LACT|nr:histidine kinase [Fundicoccus culcitae]UUX35141.1 histidine kinase [Fundicoccus culcitae]